MLWSLTGIMDRVEVGFDIQKCGTLFSGAKFEDAEAKASWHALDE